MLLFVKKQRACLELLQDLKENNLANTSSVATRCSQLCLVLISGSLSVPSGRFAPGVPTAVTLAADKAILRLC